MIKPVKLLNVFLNLEGERIKTGRLAIRDGRIFFEYDGTFVKNPLPLSPFKLPVKQGVFEESTGVFGGLFGLFDDSLPDGWGRLILERKLRSSGVDHEKLSLLDRLAFVGKSGMGALEYEPEFKHSADYDEFLQLDTLAADAYGVFNNENKELDKLIDLNGSSMGARPKIVSLVSKDKKKVIRGDISDSSSFEPWIIKFAASFESRDFGKSEYDYSEAAKKTGVEMEDTYLFPSGTCAGYFGTRRFDRRGNKKFHVHTVSGLIHSNFRYPLLDYEAIMKLALVLTDDIREVLKVFRLMIFNVKHGNKDDHSKNFAFIMNKEGVWRFAPAYDITKSEGIGGEHTTTVNGKGKDITDKDFLTLGNKFDIDGGQIKDIIRQNEDIRL